MRQAGWWRRQNDGETGELKRSLNTPRSSQTPLVEKPLTLWSRCILRAHLHGGWSRTPERNFTLKGSGQEQHPLHSLWPEDLKAKAKETTMGRITHDHQAMLKKHGMGKYERLSFGREHFFFLSFSLKKKKNAILEVYTGYFFSGFWTGGNLQGTFWESLSCCDYLLQA